MKKLICILSLLLCFLFIGCESNATIQGIELPFEEADIQQIELTHHNGDPANSRRKIVTVTEDIHYIYNTFSSEILLEPQTQEHTDPSSVLRIRFCLADGRGFSMEYQGFSVKMGVLSSSDGDFTYFTPADVAWIWDQLTNGYETEAVSLAPYGATEQPVEE